MSRNRRTRHLDGPVPCLRHLRAHPRLPDLPTVKPSIPNERWRQHLAAHVPVARAGEDPEGVHQVRVAAGRLIVWTEMAGPDEVREDLRWLRSKAGAVRDLDVLLMHDPRPHPVWEADLRRRRDVARGDLLAALDEPRAAKLITRLPELPAVERSAAEKLVRDYAKKARKRGKRLEKQGAHLEDYHRLRRVLRRLRFALEWLEIKPKPLKALQTAFGDLNDRAIALDYLDRCEGKEAIPEEYVQKLEEDLEKHRLRAREAWAKHHTELEDPLEW